MTHIRAIHTDRKSEVEVASLTPITWFILLSWSKTKQPTQTMTHTNNRCQVSVGLIVFMPAYLQHRFYTVTLLLCSLQDETEKDKMEDKSPMKHKPKSRELFNPIIPLECPEKEDLEPSEYIDHTRHNTPSNSSLGKYIIKIPRFDSGSPGEENFFMDLVQKALVGQNVSSRYRMFQPMRTPTKIPQKTKSPQAGKIF